MLNDRIYEVVLRKMFQRISEEKLILVLFHVTLA